MGGMKNNGNGFAGMAVLSQDRKKWIEIELELLYGASGRGAIYLNGEIYLCGGLINPKVLYKLDKNLKWIRLADMNVGRGGIENNCLEWNGDIWVFGGRNPENEEYLKSVERYDPKKNKWTLMADMKEARSNAAATLWNNKIIICGGWTKQNTLTKTAECYNSEDNSWNEFTPLPKPLGGHSLVTYENKLILFGGLDGKGATNAVWELDPQESNRTWKPLEPMKYPSVFFTGIILDQEIYAIGGWQKIDLYLSRVEIFDGERWRDGAALPYSWAFMSSLIIPPTLADRLYQYKKEKISQTILIMGGVKNNETATGMAVSSQNRTKWIEIELELPYEALGSGAIYLNGEIYLFGGYFNLKALYKLDKNLNWIRLADMNVGRGGIENNCLEWNGYIWVFGGRDPENEEYLKSVERYDPKKNKWTLMADMKYERSHAAATLWNNKIIICGGFIEGWGRTDTAECYNPEDNSCIEFPSLPEPLSGHSLVTYENKLILFGGASNETTNAVWELDPQESNPTWKSLSPMKYPSACFAGIIIDQEIYAIGGRQKKDLSRVEIFDGERWRDGAALPYWWVAMSSLIIPQTLADRLSQYKKE